MASKKERVFALTFALLFLFTSVGASAFVIWSASHNKDQTPAQTAQDQINQKENKLEGTKLANFTPVDKVDTVQSTDIKVGTGVEVKDLTTALTFHYTGALAKDGTIFQSSHDTGQPITYPLNQLISGWQQGIPGMKEGGVRRLLIPSSLGYGAQSQPGIPANSDLVFDIELVKVN